MTKINFQPHSLFLVLLLICGTSLFIQLKAQYISYLPITVNSSYYQPFEMITSSSNFTQWTTNLAGNDVNWRSHIGSTPSSNTGPSFAKDGARYMYVEASLPTQPQSEAILASPVFNVSNLTVPKVTFSFNMNGSQMGTLHFEYSVNNSSYWSTVRTYSGNRGNTWFTPFVHLPQLTNATSVRFRFRAITGSGYRSDIAIDRFLITEGSTNKTTTTDSESLEVAVQNNGVQLSAYPNPFTNALNVSVREHEAEMTLTLYNLQGQQLLERHVTLNDENLKLETQDIPAGNYLLRISGGEVSKTIRLTKQ